MRELRGGKTNHGQARVSWALLSCSLGTQGSETEF